MKLSIVSLECLNMLLSPPTPSLDPPTPWPAPAATLGQSWTAVTQPQRARGKPQHTRWCWIRQPPWVLGRWRPTLSQSQRAYSQSRLPRGSVACTDCRVPMASCCEPLVGHCLPFIDHLYIDRHVMPIISVDSSVWGDKTLKQKQDSCGEHIQMVGGLFTKYTQAKASGAIIFCFYHCNKNERSALRQYYFKNNLSMISVNNNEVRAKPPPRSPTKRALELAAFYKPY